MKIFRATAFVHGFYYLFTGLWPLFDIESFMAVTGPKNDIWLVKTVGVLVMAIAVPVLWAAIQKKAATGILLLGITSAVGFTLIDVVYVLNGTISVIYLGDAVLEVLLLAGWLSAVVKLNSTES